MRRLLLILMALLTLAARPAPTGEFMSSPGPYLEGGSITFTITDVDGVNRNYEVTLGVWCRKPDGTEIPWGNRANPVIYEFNSFGTELEGLPLVRDLPVEGTGYSCIARLISAHWFKGSVIGVWVLDEMTFEVRP